MPLSQKASGHSQKHSTVLEAKHLNFHRISYLAIAITAVAELQFEIAIPYPYQMDFVVVARVATILERQQTTFAADSSYSGRCP